MGRSILWISVQTNSFKPTERQYSASKAVRLPVATADTGKLIAAATAALGIIFKPGYSYKKVGVTFLDLVAADRVQGGLFDRPDNARSIRRMHAFDQLNARFGRGTVGFGTAGERQCALLPWSGSCYAQVAEARGRFIFCEIQWRPTCVI
jgi:DNA polymerase V